MASQKCPKNVIFKYALGQIAQNSMNFLRPKINVPLPGSHWKMTPACLFCDQSNNDGKQITNFIWFELYCFIITTLANMICLQAMAIIAGINGGEINSHTPY